MKQFGDNDDRNDELRIMFFHKALDYNDKALVKHFFKVKEANFKPLLKDLEQLK